MELEITNVLKRAADDAALAKEYNTNREPSIRPSRAGLPLLQLVLEDILLPKLLPATEKRWYKPDPFASAMRLSTGYLFEKAVEELLLREYEKSTTKLLTQETLTVGDISGSCDMLAVNHELKQAVVIECKALKAYSVDEVKQQKLLCDNWGYFTQLVLYVLATKVKYPDYNVFGTWYVWMKPLERHTQVMLDLPEVELQQVLTEVTTKAQHYHEFKRDFSEGKLSYAVGKLMMRTEDLPQKIRADGYLKGSCSLHFNNYCRLLTNVQGTLLDNAEDTMVLLTRAAYYGNDSEHQKELTKLLQQ